MNFCRGIKNREVAYERGYASMPSNAHVPSGRTDCRFFPPLRGQAHVYLVASRSQNQAIQPASMSGPYGRQKELHGYTFNFLSTQGHQINNNKRHIVSFVQRTPGRVGSLGGLLGVRLVDPEVQIQIQGPRQPCTW